MDETGFRADKAPKRAVFLAANSEKHRDKYTMWAEREERVCEALLSCCALLHLSAHGLWVKPTFMETAGEIPQGNKDERKTFFKARTAFSACLLQGH